MTAPIYYGYHWWIGTTGQDTFTYPSYASSGNDTFQLGGSEGVGGVNNNWDTFDGGPGTGDRIYVASKSGYAWTAIMIADNGLDNVEKIQFGTSGSIKPVYFAGDVDFTDVTTMTAGVKIYGRGNDNHFIGGGLGEYVEGDDGNDILEGNGGNDTLYGDTYNNPWPVNTNAAGDDALYGGAGDDMLYGQGGSDLLDGGSGTNHLWGGAGNDAFEVSNANDHSIIEDFTDGSEYIVFDSSIADEYADLTIYDDTDGAHVTVGNVDLTVVGITAASLTNADFLFA